MLTLRLKITEHLWKQVTLVILICCTRLPEFIFCQHSDRLIHAGENNKISSLGP